MCLFCHCRTWSGPAWSPAQSLSSVLISIQSLLNEKPYHNEPGFEQVSWYGVLWCTYSYYLESKWKVNENSEFNFTQTSKVTTASCFHIFIISTGSERQLSRKTCYGGSSGKGPWGAFIFRPKVRLADLKYQDSMFLLEVPPRPPPTPHIFIFVFYILTQETVFLKMVGEVGGLRCLKRCLESLPSSITAIFYPLAQVTHL